MRNSLLHLVILVILSGNLWASGSYGDDNVYQKGKAIMSGSDANYKDINICVAKDDRVLQANGRSLGAITSVSELKQALINCDTKAPIVDAIATEDLDALIHYFKLHYTLELAE